MARYTPVHAGGHRHRIGVLTYDQTTGMVDIDKDNGQLPEGFTYQKSDGNRFIFIWTK